MKAKLVGLKGSVAGQSFALDPNATVIFGRGGAATYRVEDSGVSRTHCSVEYEDSFYVIEDLGSRNGTWVNGRRISRAKLVHYDSISIGALQFRFELEPALAEDGTELVPFDDENREHVGEIRERVELESSVEIIALEPAEESIERYRQLQRDLAAICRIGNAVNAEEDLEKLLNIILDKVMDLTQADRGYVLMPFGPKGDLQPVTARVRRHSAAGQDRLYSRTLAAQCFKSGYAFLKSDFGPDAADATQSIVEQDIRSVMCVPLRSREGTVGAIYVDNLAGSHTFRKRDLDVLAAIGNQAGIAIRRAQLADRVERLFSDCMVTLVSVLEAKDEYTKGHSERVTSVALRIGQIIGLTAEESKDLQLAGLLHDIGKIAIEKQILDKPTSLTAEEYNDIKRHPVLGSKIISSIHNAETISGAIRHHHETWDGQGYPDQIKGDKIPLLARILAIADAFDSMVSNRPYRRNMTAREVIEEFQRCAGNQFDPHIVEVFLAAWTSDPSFLAGISEIYDNKIESAGAVGAPAVRAISASK